MRILITGATGQLGCELRRVFASETLILKDLPDFDLAGSQVEEDVVGAQPDLIIHTGAYTDVDGAERESGRAMAVNAFGTARVARAAVRAGARLLYISTDYVFPGTQRHPYSEDDVPAPVNAYGLSKWKGELAVTESGADALIVRTAWLYGSMGKNFVKSIMRAAQAQPSLRVVDDQRGSPTSVEDLAAVIKAVATGSAQGILHATNRGDCTWCEFARAIVEEMNLNIPVLPISTAEAGRLAPRPPYSVLGQQRLARLNLAPRGWREALALFIKAERALVSVHP
ncbi:MAG: Spore coat polysaccharide biosynthesis protein SpsK [Nitrospira sp.]|nr:MAG: Spore coat polysaccharide biosynthesis protein SpsK [Nitrospira sp.]